MAGTKAACFLTFTGERVIPGLVEPDLWNEHVSRYRFAALFAADKRVLDVGCGSGYGTELLALTAKQALGCDISPETIEYASATNANAQFILASASALPALSGSIDLVTAFEVIEHLRDWEGLITEAGRVLTKNGLFVVSTPNKTYYSRSREQVGANPFHEHEFELDEFRRSLQKVFPIVQILGQNHQQSVVFSAQQTSVEGSAFVPTLSELSDAHFFVAVCSRQPLEIPSYAYIPGSANLLSERERHIGLLQAELAEVQAEKANLLSAHRRLNAELEEQNNWARRLDRELLESAAAMSLRAAENSDLSSALDSLRLETAKLRNELTGVKRSYWLRIGRALDIGPWTEGRLHLKRLARFMAPPFRIARHVAECFIAAIALMVTALVLAAEDICFWCFGKRSLPASTAAAHQAATVVIANWNGLELLKTYLPSVVVALSGDENNEIIIVDNASSDGSSDFVRASFPGVRVLQMDRNVGFGAGSNAGMRAAKNDIVVLLNNDMRVERDFLAPLLKPFQNDPLVFAVSSQIFFADQTKRREETGLTEVWWEKGRIKASHRIDPKVRSAYPCAYPGGGSSAFDRRKFLELGGFDRLFEPFYYEDTDLGFGAWKRGWKLYYQPLSVVHHCHRATVRKHFVESFVDRVISKNSILYCWKNIHDWKMLSHHFFVCLLNCGQFRPRTEGEYDLSDVARACWRLRSTVKSRWLSLSKAAISDRLAFNRPLGGYFRDTFIAPHETAPARLRVLFASPYPIEPPIHGGGVFMRQALVQLTSLADVHLVSFLDNDRQLRDQYPLHRICKSAQFLVRPGIVKRFWTFSPLPVRQFANRDFSWLVHRTMMLEQIDVVQIEYTMLGQYAGEYSHIPCLLFEHDVFSQTLKRGLTHGSLTSTLVLEYLRMRFYEPRLLKRFTRVQVCSHSNADYLKQLAPAVKAIDVDMRAAVDTGLYSVQPQQRDFKTLLFLGGFNHAPNREGLHWFITKVFGLILAAVPDALLEIVGSNPPAGPNIWDDNPNIRMLGEVSDVRLPLRRAGIFICPIFAGSGIRVKLLEAFASEIPVVSTSLGAEGLASESGLICELADTPEAFAASVLTLLTQSEYRNRLVEQARLMVVRQRDSRAAISRLEESYRKEVLQVRPHATGQTA